MLGTSLSLFSVTVLTGAQFHAPPHLTNSLNLRALYTCRVPHDATTPVCASDMATIIPGLCSNKNDLEMNKRNLSVKINEWRPFSIVSDTDETHFENTRLRFSRLTRRFVAIERVIVNAKS